MKPKIKPKVKSKVQIKEKPVVWTGDKDFDQKLNEIMAHVEFAKIRANRVQLSKQYGKKFDDWYEKLKNIDLIKAGRAEVLHHFKAMRQYQNLKRKPKQLVASVNRKEFTEDNPPAENDNSPEALVYKLFKLDADAHKMSVKEYREYHKKKRLEQQKYDSEHWIAPLLNGQIFSILVQNETKPYKYMNKPVSRENEWRIEQFKDTKGWKEYKEKQNKKTNALTGIHLPKAIVEAQKQYQDTINQINKSIEPTRKAIETIKSWGNPLNIGLNPFGLGLPKDLQDFVVEQGGLLGNGRVIKKKDNGLNSYAVRINANDGIDVAEHYLNTYDNPSAVDYAVTDYENAGALAYSVGLLPAELFKITCDYIKRRKKEFRRRIIENETGYLIEMLVNKYLSKVKENKQKGLGAYTITQFYQTPTVQNFLKHYKLDYDYKRFDKQMQKWIKIYTSEAKKIT